MAKKQEAYLENFAARLRACGLRPTRPRLALAQLLFGTGTRPLMRHVTAEMLYSEAQAAGLSVSQATIYNTLNQFLAAGLLRQVVVDVTRSYFDTNTTEHHHFYMEDEARLIDVDKDAVGISHLPQTPQGYGVCGVDVVIRLQSKSCGK